MEHKYNYKSYSTKPIVDISYPSIDVTKLKNKKSDKDNKKTTLSIEEFANIIISNTEQKRGYRFASEERRKLKRQIIKDIKNGKYKLK